jgi:DNA-binding NtrC family response regulator
MKRVLIVEPNVEQCLSISDMLDEMGFETGVSDTSSRAMHMLSEADPLPDVMVINVKSGEGRRFREMIRHDLRYSNIGVVEKVGNKTFSVVTSINKVKMSTVDLLQQVLSLQ